MIVYAIAVVRQANALYICLSRSVPTLSVNTNSQVGVCVDCYQVQATKHRQVSSYIHKTRDCITSTECSRISFCSFGRA
jgi:hypothetical protein